jgi:aspartyl-tRNA(Asn)/glutamyl-tRNA(Gln) amidotransferase subunit A
MPRMRTARAIAADVRRGAASAQAEAQAALARAHACQAQTNAFIVIDDAGAMAAARSVDAIVRAGGDPGPLAGVPLAVKDNLCVQDLGTTAGAAVLRGYRSPFEATAVARLRAAGAVVVGTTNLDAFGMGSSSEHSAFGPVRNPRDVTRVAGGSSGGSAAAVAAGVVPLALGSDTGGSVRQPAAFCGVLGIKPTYGRVSRYGLIAYASSLDQVGVLAADAEDAATALALMAGDDPFDATSAARPATEVGPQRVPMRLALLAPGLRLGVIPELLAEGVSAGVRAAVERVVARLRAAGAHVVECPVPEVRHAVACYYVLAMAEASSNLARYDGSLYGLRAGRDDEGQQTVSRRSRAAGLGREVTRRVLLGSYVLSAGAFDAYVGRAARVRRSIAESLTRALASVDLLVAPTAPTVAWPLGERLDDPLAVYLGDVATCLANLAGLPALSLPAGGAEDGLPAGLQLMARPWEERRLLDVAAALAAVERPGAQT